jgi:Cu/Ag efflux protein CusF
MNLWKSITATLILLVAGVAHAAEQTGALRGTITARNTANNHITVAHDDVPGLMAAMTMPYEVRGQSVASLPADGTAITATLHAGDGSFWLTDVKAAAPPAHQHGAAPETPPAGPSTHTAMTHDATSALLMRQASGTSMNPAAAPMHMKMIHSGDWMLMLHGSAFVSQTVQSGPRGGDKLFSSNWVMGMADRPLAGGHLMLRSMLSLEPLTVGSKYPLLFQTGETDDGRPMIDAQHPHDFFMEIAAEYARPFTGGTIGYIYAAPFGDPSLGPVAFPHRASASEIPQASLSHHVQDSTHIAGSVLTIGAQNGPYGLALSGFHGQEPDEERWDIDTGEIDSWAVRFTYDLSPNITTQISTGHLKHPEALEETDIQRTTASISYSDTTPLGRLDASLIFGRNDFSEAHSGGTNAWLAEGVLNFGANYVTGRAEIVDKNELFAGQDVGHDLEHGNFNVKALTLGYTRDVVQFRSISAAIGGNATVYSIPDAIKPYYGSSPRAFQLFVRLRGAL